MIFSICNFPAKSVPSKVLEKYLVPGCIPGEGSFNPRLEGASMMMGFFTGIKLKEDGISASRVFSP